MSQLSQEPPLKQHSANRWSKAGSSCVGMTGRGVASSQGGGLRFDTQNIIEGTSLAGYLLAAGWLVLPAIQYLGAVERTTAAVDRTTAIGVLATLDLTPWYIVLVGATAAYACLRILSPGAPEQES